MTAVGPHPSAMLPALSSGAPLPCALVPLALPLCALAPAVPSPRARDAPSPPFWHRQFAGGSTAPPLRHFRGWGCVLGVIVAAWFYFAGEAFPFVYSSRRTSGPLGFIRWNNSTRPNSVGVSVVFQLPASLQVLRLPQGLKSR